MLKVSRGHYRDTFRRIVFDVYRLNNGGWIYEAVGQRAIGLNLGRVSDRECSTKAAAAQLARLMIGVALDASK